MRRRRSSTIVGRLLPDLAASGRGVRHRARLEHELERGEGLADLVVQLARQASPLVLLDTQDALEEGPPMVLHLLALRDVLDNADQPQWAAVFVENGFSAHMDHTNGTVRPHDPRFEAQPPPLRVGRLVRLGDELAVFRVHPAEELVVDRRERAGIDAVDAEQLVGREDRPRPQVPLEASDVGDLLRLRELPLPVAHALEHGAELPLAGPEGLLDPEAIGDVVVVQEDGIGGDECVRHVEGARRP